MALETLQEMPTITYQEEPFSAVLPELEPHWQAHYLETQREHDTMPLDVDIETYQLLEQQDAVSVVTMRADGVLVGYFVTVLAWHLKSRHVRMGSVDAYYIAPAYRRQGAGTALFQAAEDALRARGVQRLFGDTKAWNHAETIFERCGWWAVGMQYTKWIGGA